MTDKVPAGPAGTARERERWRRRRMEVGILNGAAQKEKRKKRQQFLP